jgi:hypothetical protein
MKTKQMVGFPILVLKGVTSRSSQEQDVQNKNE